MERSAGVSDLWNGIAINMNQTRSWKIGRETILPLRGRIEGDAKSVANIHKMQNHYVGLHFIVAYIMGSLKIAFFILLTNISH